MPRIKAVAAAVPPARVDQDLAVEFARAMFADKIPDFERLLPLFANAGTGYATLPPLRSGFSPTTTWPKRAPCTPGRRPDFRPKRRARP